MMRVNYSSQLVALIHEVRQLTALGYRIPASIQEISNHAEQFMKHAKILEQVHKKNYKHILYLKLCNLDCKFPQYYW